MVAAPKPSLYSALLRAYPRRFRSYYGPTMQQTFSDMLEAEHNRAGRFKVWARTLVDLPFSATKEHVTNGKELYMNRTSKIILGVSVLAILVVGVGSYWAGKLHAMQTSGIEHVTTAQIANAMQQDDFYSTYGNAALLFKGTVASVKQGNNATLVTFKTGVAYNVVCQFATTVSPQVGSTISVAAPGGPAERQPHGVLLHSCVQN